MTAVVLEIPEEHPEFCVDNLKNNKSSLLWHVKVWQ